MKNSLTAIFLFLSGFLLLGIGGTILLFPHAFYANDGILLGNDPSLLSEIRASGGLLAGSSLVILFGTFRTTLRSLVVAITIFVYGSFGTSRLLGMALDGMPSNGLVIATAIELIIAALGIMILCCQPLERYSNNSN
ncbi:MAG: DUF4345 domain-containing protein [Cyanobacteria bacterium J06635_13]